MRYFLVVNRKRDGIVLREMGVQEYTSIKAAHMGAYEYLVDHSVTEVDMYERFKSGVASSMGTYSKHSLSSFNEEPQED
jgi:hypothetical protein